LTDLVEKKELADEEAMMRFQNGDAGAFDFLLHRHSAAILRFIMNMMTVNKSNAEDLLQEIFMKVIENRKRYDSNRKFTTWLYTVARNRCIDYLKVEKHRRYSSLDAPLNSEASDGRVKLEIVRSYEKNQEEKMMNKEIRAILRSGVDNLRQEFREVFLLREIEGLSLREIADITNVPIGTVKSRLRYAYLNLRENFIQAGYFEEKQIAKGV
jgi:RNA polymerase sigma-70 factor (ECF subfamily)